jgi:UPF0716 protein FxsA
MRLVKMIAIGLLAWPLAEVAAFVVVAALVGMSMAFLLMILVSCAGLFVLRHFGGRVTQLRGTAGRGRVGAINLDETGIMPGLGGILLVIPGFITGLIGVVMLFPVSRRWLLAGCQRLFAATPQPAGPGIVDLAPNEWRSLSLKLPHTNEPPKDGTEIS